MNLQTLIPASDKLTNELVNVFGGAKGVDQPIECKGDGVIYFPTNPTRPTATLTIF
jgi:hypothetical protein